MTNRRHLFRHDKLSISFNYSHTSIFVGTYKAFLIPGVSETENLRRAGWQQKERIHMGLSPMSHAPNTRIFIVIYFIDSVFQIS
jgi:hypothetical protein